jgi:D-serine deaminase-like pyridoxal phosphate-dependent protein
MADQLAALRGVRWRGIRSHSGKAYSAATTAARRAIALEDARVMSETAQRIADRGLPCEIVSIGSTPGIAGVASAASLPGVTEWRPGNYVFFDRMQLSLGTATLQDCALRIVVSVVSTPAEGRAMIDAGRKTLTATVDPLSSGYGQAIGHPGVEVSDLSEECGWLRHWDDDLRVGSRLELIPNHACEITNLVEVVAHGTDGVVEGFWEPVGRGKIW